MSTAVKKEEEVKEFELTSVLEVSESKDSATITYDENQFDLFIGEALSEALKNISTKTDEYFGLVVNDSTKQTKELLDSNEEIKMVSITAPIYSKDRGDKLEILNLREEIEDTDVPLERLNVKVTQNLGRPIQIQSAAALLRKK